MKINTTNKVLKYLPIYIFMFLLNACGSAEHTEYTREVIIKNKLCPEVTYRCLSENKNTEKRKVLLNTKFIFLSKDLLWIRLSTIEKVFEHYKVDKGIDEKGNNAFNQLRNKVIAYGDTLRHKVHDNGNGDMTKMALTIAAEFMNQTEEELVSDKYYQLTEREERDIRQRRSEQSYVEIAQLMELLYPGFWGDTPKKEQLKWVIQVERLGKRIQPSANGRGTIEVMAGICGLIGIDFEENPKHKPIVDYLSTIAKNGDVGQLSQTWDYLTFVYLERDYDFSGRHLNGWAMRDALANLPRPKREVQSLSNTPDDKMYHEPSDLWKIYEKTIENGGKP